MQRVFTGCVVAMFSLTVGCGSALEDPISNADGCRIINEALSTVCTGEDALEWLNCDVLPGCPSGTVEGQHIKTCALEIESAASCSKAKQMECTISKLDCGSAAEPFTEAIGMGKACELLLAAAATQCKSSDMPSYDAYVKCSGGAVENQEVETCVDKILGMTTCSAAKSPECSIQPKYCLPTL